MAKNSMEFREAGSNDFRIVDGVGEKIVEFAEKRLDGTTARANAHSLHIAITNLRAGGWESGLQESAYQELTGNEYDADNRP